MLALAKAVDHRGSSDIRVTASQLAFLTVVFSPLPDRAFDKVGEQCRLRWQAAATTLDGEEIESDDRIDKGVYHDVALLAIPRNDEGSNMTKTKVYASVWDALGDTPEQAANLRARAERMQQIAAIVKKNRWTQTEAARHCGITQPRMNDLLRGRVSRFSLDALVNIATAIGRRVHMELESA
jgi:predicted XRE-type DNA-binding protein